MHARLEDGDMDCIVGTDSGQCDAFENIGTKYEPFFVKQGALWGGSPKIDKNQWYTLDVGSYAVPSCFDMDGDGDAGPDPDL